MPWYDFDIIVKPVNGKDDRNSGICLPWRLISHLSHALNICYGYNDRHGRKQTYHPGEMSPNGWGKA